MNPNEQRVHTNLSLAYMRSGDKETAEHHGLRPSCPDGAAIWRHRGAMQKMIPENGRAEAGEYQAAHQISRSTLEEKEGLT